MILLKVMEHDSEPGASLPSVPPNVKIVPESDKDESREVRRVNGKFKRAQIALDEGVTPGPHAGMRALTRSFLLACYLLVIFLSRIHASLILYLCLNLSA